MTCFGGGDSQLPYAAANLSCQLCQQVRPGRNTVPAIIKVATIPGYGKRGGQSAGPVIGTDICRLLPGAV